MGGGDKFKVLSLFAGIGGFDLGLERTGGFETVAVAEVDPYASRVLAKHFPCAVNIGDVTQAEFPDADYIAAGFPCQDISFAGAGAGLAGTRSGLWREVVRAIRMVRPRGAVLENVAALLSRGLDTVLGDLAEVGHDAEWHCIPASAAGAPHRRDRIWIVTNARGIEHEGGRAPISGALSEELSRCTPDAESIGRVQREPLARWGDERVTPRQELGFGDVCASLADTDSERGCGRDTHRQDATNAGKPSRHPRHDAGRMGWWAVEPNVGRVAHGIPKRVDRLRCLGNAVVPQIPEMIGRAILQTEGR